jgi:selenoprotein W-related protein
MLSSPPGGKNAPVGNVSLGGGIWMPTDVEVEYCVPCGHLEQAINTQRAILTEFGQKLRSVALVTGDKGVFKIRVNGEEIFDKNMGYDEAAILASIKERLDA